MNLFGESVDQKGSPTPRILKLYHDLFVERFGFKPRISGGKDGNLVKSLVESWGEDEVTALVRYFMRTPNPRVTRSDYSIGALHAMAQGLMIDVRNQRPDEVSARIMDAVERAMDETNGRNPK